MPQSKRRPAGRRDRRPRLNDAFYQRMIRNPEQRIPFVLTEEGMQAR